MRRIFSVLLFCACFCASAALKDLANYGVIPSPQEVEEKELDKKRQDELDKIDWLSGAENVEANEILFSKKQMEKQKRKDRKTLYTHSTQKTLDWRKCQ